MSEIEQNARSWTRGVAITACIVVASVVLGKPRPPRMDRADQSREHTEQAIKFIQQNVLPSELTLTSYQSDLTLGHYLCQQLPISFEAAQPGFEQFTCAGHRIISSNYKDWVFSAENFPQVWQRFLQSYKPTPGESVWIIQMGWGVGLPEDLRAHYPQFRSLQFTSFGSNIKIFKLPVGQPVPLSSATVE